MIIYAGILIVHAALNIFGVRVVAFLSDVSVWWHLLGVLVIVISLHRHTGPPRLGVVRLHRSGQRDRLHHTFYVFMIGLLLAQYTFTGYDASAHMTEETHNAAIAGPKGIVNSILVSLVAGFVLLVGLTYAIQHGRVRQGAAPPRASLRRRSGSTPSAATAGELLLVVAMVAQAYCGMASVTANSRMIYAFSETGPSPDRSSGTTSTPAPGRRAGRSTSPSSSPSSSGCPYLWSAVAYGGRHLDRRHRPLHRLRHPDLAAAQGRGPL